MKNNKKKVEENIFGDRQWEHLLVVLTMRKCLKDSIATSHYYYFPANSDFLLELDSIPIITEFVIWCFF